MVTHRNVAPTPEYQRLVRFLAVGASGTLLDATLLVVLLAAGLPVLIANVLSFGAGIVNNYVWNRMWTYHDARTKPLKRQLAQFVLVSLVGLAINSIIVVTLGSAFGVLLGGAAWGYLVAKIVATAASVVWNYIANRHWTFDDAQHERQTIA